MTSGIGSTADITGIWRTNAGARDREKGKERDREKDTKSRTTWLVKHDSILCPPISYQSHIQVLIKAYILYMSCVFLLATLVCFSSHSGDIGEQRQFAVPILDLERSCLAVNWEIGNWKRKRDITIGRFTIHNGHSGQCYA